MALLNRLLGIWIVGKTVSSTTPLFIRLILGMAVITLLAVFCAVILAMLVAGGAWFGYSQMVDNGVTEVAAFSIIGLIMFSLLLTIGLFLQHYLRKANAIAKRIMYLQAPISGRFSMISDAFMNGFNVK